MTTDPADLEAQLRDAVARITESRPRTFDDIAADFQAGADAATALNRRHEREDNSKEHHEHE